MNIPNRHCVYKMNNNSPYKRIDFQLKRQAKERNEKTNQDNDSASQSHDKNLIYNSELRKVKILCLTTLTQLRERKKV